MAMIHYFLRDIVGMMRCFFYRRVHGRLVVVVAFTSIRRQEPHDYYLQFRQTACEKNVSARAAAICYIRDLRIPPQDLYHFNLISVVIEQRVCAWK